MLNCCSDPTNLNKVRSRCYFNLIFEKIGYAVLNHTYHEHLKRIFTVLDQFTSYDMI